jgi:hypothetical protein
MILDLSMMQKQFLQMGGCCQIRTAYCIEQISNAPNRRIPLRQLRQNILHLLREVFQQVNLKVFAAFLPLLARKTANESGQIKEACRSRRSWPLWQNPRTTEGKKGIIKLSQSSPAIRQPP